MKVRDDTVAVTVPATSANLGPGFDSMGLALSLHDSVAVRATAGTTSVVVEGEGAGQVPDGEDNLVVRAVREALDRVGAPQVGIRMRCTNRIPHGHGLGSSASALIAGYAVARGLIGDPDALTADDLLQLGTEAEGHPDNIAPALLGGATIAWVEQGRAGMIGLSPPPEIQPVAFIPSFALATSTARAVLPRDVPHADAAFNVSRAALLAALLAGAGRPASGGAGDGDGAGDGARDEGDSRGTRTATFHELLMRATGDRLHQEYRRGAMESSLALVDWLREAGYAAVVSGAGPTVLSLESVPEAVRDQAARAGWAVRPLPVSARGVRQTRGLLTGPVV